MAFDFAQQVTRPYINRTSDGFEQVAINYVANSPFYFSCRFKAGWDGNDDKYLMSLQNGNVDGNVFNYGIYQNRLTTWSGTYDTAVGAVTFQNITRKLDLVYTGGILKVYLDNQLVNSRSLTVAAATYVRIGEYHNSATQDSFIGEIWDWMFVSGDLEYVSPSGVLYVSDGTSYTTTGDSLPNNVFTNLYKYRTIYTRGYLGGGYKNSTPWRNINRTAHSTDITTNLGDVLDRSSGYIDGGWSDYYGYLYVMMNGINQSWGSGVTGTYVSSYNLTTETGRTNSTNWHLKTNRYEPGCIINSTLTIAYITAGGSTATDKHNYVTETMYVAGSVAANPSVSADQAAVIFGETKGWVAAGGGVASIDFATETWTNGGMAFTGTDGHSKALGSKHGHAYGKNAGNTATTQVHKYNDTTGSTIRNDIYTPESSGEENFQQGQNWGYCVGHYNGVQNNNTYKQNYLTDIITSMGADCQPKGHDGASSAGCSSASALLLGGV